MRLRPRARGGGDAGIRGAKLIAASVDGVAAMGAAAVDGGARLLTTSALVISMGGLPGATRVWPQACLLAMIWIRDAGIRGATPLVAPVDRIAASIDLLARMLTSVALVTSMGLPGAKRVWLQACVLAMIWIRDGLRCLKDLVFKFRHAARSMAPSSPSVPPPIPATTL